MEHNKQKAIYELYSNIKSIMKNDNDEYSFLDASGNIIEVNVDWSAVETKANELQAIEEAKPSIADIKASAKAKLIAGEALTEDEANTIVL
tara:strand:- start:104 stop:376 length:273 start_codon:yes stop_codon:yes gene_type:complete